MRTNSLRLVVLFAVAATLTASVQAERRLSVPTSSVFVSGLGVLFGTTIGPDGALYVAEIDTGRILRVDPQSGTVSTFVSGVPTNGNAGGGPFDVVFLGQTAYVLVSLVDSTVGGDSADGIYRVDGPDQVTLIADIGQFALDHPPQTSFEVPTGLQYALDTYRGDFIVADGHHNRVYRVTLGGQVSELIAFPDIVPTGLAVRGKTIYMAEAGPVPHVPENGKIVAFTAGNPIAVEVASGARLLVDVEFGQGERLFALSQGQFPDGGQPGDPALPNTGSMVEARDGTLVPILTGISDPTSFDFIGNTAYVTTLGGEILRVQLPNTSRKPDRTGRHGGGSRHADALSASVADRGENN